MKRYNLYRLLQPIAALLLLAGCTKDPIQEQAAPRSGDFTLTAVAENKTPEQVVTRASDPKTEAECEIRTLHVFLFGADRNYLATREGYPLVQGYQTTASSTLHIDATAFADPETASNARSMWWPMLTRAPSE